MKQIIILFEESLTKKVGVLSGKLFKVKPC